MKLQREFYVQSAEVVAPELLGKILCCKLESGEVLRHRITETECYLANDTACHAHRGKTSRNAVMFEGGGIAYVYLCYGIHNLLNVVTGEVGEPEAVLIRGVEGFDGPGKLTKAMGVDRSQNGTDLVLSEDLWIEDDGVKFKYNTTVRIGIDYASDVDRMRLWRFVMK